MTFRDIVNAVLLNAFDEGSRSDAKNWVIARHAWLYDLEEWTFKFGTAPVTFTAGSQVVADVPTDFRTAVALYDSAGCRLRGVPGLRSFFDSYNGNLSVGSGRPEAFTVVGSQMLVGPAGDGSQGLLVYEKTKPQLVNDTDVTGLPDGYDLALVHGGKAEGFKLANIPLWQGFDEDFTAYANALRRNYLVAMRGQGEQFSGAYRPGSQWC